MYSPEITRSVAKKLIEAFLEKSIPSDFDHNISRFVDKIGVRKLQELCDYTSNKARVGELDNIEAIYKYFLKSAHNASRAKLEVVEQSNESFFLQSHG